MSRPGGYHDVLGLGETNNQLVEKKKICLLEKIYTN